MAATPTPQSANPMRRQVAPRLWYKQEWCSTHLGVPFSIKFWGKEEGMNEGNGVWNYYVYLHEDFTPDFEKLWLPDKVYKFKPEAKGHITHDYYEIGASDVDWHGGVTYYAKHGYTEGFRRVELGCDYSHLWDSEAGYPADLNWLLEDCKKTIEQLVQKLGLKTREIEGSV